MHRAFTEGRNPILPVPSGKRLQRCSPGALHSYTQHVRLRSKEPHEHMQPHCVECKVEGGIELASAPSYSNGSVAFNSSEAKKDAAPITASTSSN